ncbi:Flp family type IVb pilin [Fimbriiglobus ruber]|uniref:Flp pilus assembly protein, pilin Flp n=1 Tax=Fimbriiglobus ruber TaxID=1908690 RepID=A0A225DFU0_9BACT|nr:Flp family type IVb pilin [Fimbriiglobus ruber]OWK35265.1 hypothetical protein FRUB_09426 [Fimbriiglobus ruber]
MFAKLWKDEEGAVALEYLLLLTIVGLGMVIGFSNLSNALNAEYTELGNAILALSQGYEVATRSGCSATTQGSQAIDIPSNVTFGTNTVTPAAINPNNVYTGVNVCP